MVIVVNWYGKDSSSRLNPADTKLIEGRFKVVGGSRCLFLYELATFSKAR